MFGIGFPELLLILALALIVVGPDKLPDLARSIAKTLVDLKKTAEGLKESMNTEDNPLHDIKPTLEDAAKNFKEHVLDDDAPAWKVPDDLDELNKANRVNEASDHPADAHTGQRQDTQEKKAQLEQDYRQASQLEKDGDNGETPVADPPAKNGEQEIREKQKNNSAGEQP